MIHCRLALHTIGHLLFGHQVPANYAKFLSQRVEINYFAMVLLDTRRRGGRLPMACRVREGFIVIDDLCDNVYCVLCFCCTIVYQPRNTLSRPGLAMHFMHISQNDVIYKIYEHGGV